MVICLNRGKITFYTHPPEGHLSGHVSTEIVQQWGEAFDIDALVEEECKDLKGTLIHCCLHRCLVTNMFVLKAWVRSKVR